MIVEDDDFVIFFSGGMKMKPTLNSFFKEESGIIVDEDERIEGRGGWVGHIRLVYGRAFF